VIRPSLPSPTSRSFSHFNPLPPFNRIRCCFFALIFFSTPYSTTFPPPPIVLVDAPRDRTSLCPRFFLSRSLTPCRLLILVFSRWILPPFPFLEKAAPSTSDPFPSLFEQILSPRPTPFSVSSSLSHGREIFFLAEASFPSLVSDLLVVQVLIRIPSLLCTVFPGLNFFWEVSF